MKKCLQIYEGNNFELRIRDIAHAPNKCDVNCYVKENSESLLCSHPFLIRYSRVEDKKIRK